MRILLVIEELNVGGAERVVVNLANTLNQLGHQVGVLCLRSAGDLAPELDSGIERLILDKQPGIDWRLPRKIRQAVAGFEPDVIKSHLWVANLWTRLSLFDHPIPLFAVEHSRDSWKPRYYRWIDRLLIHVTEKLIAVSNDTAAFYREQGISPAKIVVIGNGIDCRRVQGGDRDSLRGTLGLGPRTQVIGTLGRLAPEKNQARLLKAFAKYQRHQPDSALLIAGEGPLRPSLEALSQTLGIESKVHWLGQRHDLANLYASFDLFALSSDREGLPLTALEAQCAGVPVVLTEVGGNREAVITDQGVTSARLCAPCESALNNCFVELLSDEQQRQAMSDLALAQAPERFGLEAMAKAYLSLFEATRR